MRKNFGNKKNFGKRDSEKGGFRSKSGFTKKRFGSDDRPYKKNESPGKGENRGEKKFDNSEGEKNDFRKKEGDTQAPAFRKKSFGENDRGGYKKKPRTFGSSGENNGYKKKSFGGNESGGYKKKSFGGEGGGYKGKSFGFNKPFKKTYKKKNSGSSPAYHEKKADDGSIRLNKYIANAGICSRREADVLIGTGVVKVNGKIITEMGFKVQPGDIVNYGGQTLRQEKMQYVLLNKPKDFITTLDDPQGRKNVMELLKGACSERIYPVGRLDRTTTGVLLFTNDGELTKRLTHPRYGIKKIYHVMLDQNVKRSDIDAIAAGIELEDGPIKPDSIEYVGEAKNEIGIEVHSGRNRIVRRIFEQFNYKVVKLDRVYFAGLTKKNLSRGEWRHLEEKELNMLKIVAGKVSS